MMEEAMMENKLITVKEFLKRNKERGYWPQTDSVIRNLKFNSYKNGFEMAFSKIEKHVYINEEEFWKAVKNKALSKNLLKSPIAAKLNASPEGK